jgi:endonuclease G, mitochondrial
MELGQVEVERALDRATRAGIERTIEELADGEPRRVVPRQIEVRRRALLQETPNPAVAQVRLERILAGNELSDVAYLMRGALVARSVGRVVIRRGARVLGHGTGFLVAPGVLMTNHHVLESIDVVRDSLVQFRYETDVHGAELNPESFTLGIDPPPILVPALDVVLAAVNPASATSTSLDAFGWLRLNPEPGKAFVGEYLTIIQHPRGERKQVCVRENKLLKYDDPGPYLWYQTDTVGGSSGSPVFNNSWDVVALHHSGVPKTKLIDGKQVWLNKHGQPWHRDEGDDAVDWVANEGVRTSQILRYLAASEAGSPLVQSVLGAPETPFEAGVIAPERLAGAWSTTELEVAPVEISIRVGGRSASVLPTPTSTAVLPAQPSVVAATVTTPDALPAIAVEIDKTNYHERTGYDPAFLGDDAMVPLPEILTDVDDVFRLNEHGDTELRYWTYSVVMNARRGLAFFSAANLDNNTLGEENRKGDPWTRDPRVDDVDPAAQIGPEFYDRQRTFEVEDRTPNPFDQGHLTRWKDTHWGDDTAEQKRNGDDSFHYTNCAPQHFEFNQNRRVSGIWFRLEDEATQLGDGTRMCIFNGPVFDAPESIVSEDGTLVLNPTGSRAADKQFGGHKIPKQFFKVVAYRRAGVLRTKAFVVSQELLINAIDRLHETEATGLTDAEVNLYQVKLSTLKKLTGLDFAGLAASEDVADESLEGEILRPLTSLTEVVL